MNNNHNNFDEQIKQKLGGMKSQPMYGSWESFQSKMESHPTTSQEESDTEFDEKVKNKIHTIQKTSPSHHWEKLRYKLETIEMFRKKIWLHKTKEVAAVLLFLFTFYNVMHHEGKFVGDKKYYADHNERYINYNERTETTSFIVPEGIDKQNAQFHSVKESSKGRRSNLQGKRLVSVVSSISQHQGQVVTNRDVHQDLQLQQIDKRQNQPFLSNDVSNDLVDGTALNELEFVRTLNNETYSLYATNFPMTLVSGKRHAKQTRFGIHFAHVDNFILSPYDKVYSIPKFSNSMRNQSYGLTFGKKNNQWEVETGLAYSRLIYKPAEVREIFGSSGEIAFETSLQKIQFDLWKLPVSLRFYVTENNHWKTYISAGTAVNIISEATYDIEENIVLGRPLHPSQFTNEAPRLEKKPFNKGIIDDGTLENNFYLDAHLSLGVEKSIGRFASIYIQPAYHTFLFSQGLGIGPNNDKLNAFHLQSGIKWTINN